MTSKFILAGILAAPAIMVAVPAAAQTQGIAMVTPPLAIIGSKAYQAAMQQIGTAQKPAIDQITARQTALQTEVRPLYLQMDSNKDGQVSQQELQAAQTARNPVLNTIQAAEQKAEADINRLSVPLIRAQMFAIEKILEKYNTAQTNVVNARKISVILAPSAFQYAPQGTDVTQLVAAELDKLVPTVATTPPAGWNPSQTVAQLYQQIQEYENRIAQVQAARQQQAQPAGAAPAGTRPATPAPTPARPATQTPPPGR
ncbi:OmpH family outer membrane protein [Sphingomonas sp. HF-S3]|uniref:OmpH family outer membrane protein n=1 Tax=Sphingomonas rustica TaxID=3103142 RepID=A0ABV0B8D8_9SPHN